MKKIVREGFSSIIKRKIDLNNIIDYDSLDLELIKKLLNEVIVDNIYNTIDLLKLIKDNYEGNILDAIDNIDDYSNVRFNCYYATKVLKEKLALFGIDAKVISYKSIGFSTSYGDELIKEAHMAVLIVTRKNNKLYYLILDPGLRIPLPIGFYEENQKTYISVDNDEIIIEKTNDDNYPYSMEMTGFNRYSTGNKSYWCKEYFDVYYETINESDVLFPLCFQILEGYRIIRFSEDKNKWALIKLMVVDKCLECYDEDTSVNITFSEINSKRNNELEDFLKPFTKKLDTDTSELVEIIRFVIDHYNEIINIFDPIVLNEFSKQKKLVN